MTVEHRRLIRTSDRLHDVVRLGLDLDAERPYLQSIVERVAGELGTRFVLVDVLLSDAQVFLAGAGPVPEWVQKSQGTPLEWAFCQPLVAERTARQVPDLAADPMFRDNPLVTRAGLRAYAGAPLISKNGHVLGGICGLEAEPRTFTPAELAYLQDRADEAVLRLEEFAAG